MPAQFGNASELLRGNRSYEPHLLPACSRKVTVSLFALFSSVDTLFLAHSVTDFKMTHKLSVLLLLALALHASPARCDDIVDSDPASETTVEAAKHGVDIPKFEPYAVPDAALWEQFTDVAAPRWKRSQATKKGEKEARYDGEWA
ncbi:hypothetical protein GGI13_008684, partial [Coemansia sp. RSA 455]